MVRGMLTGAGGEGGGRGGGCWWGMFVENSVDGDSEGGRVFV